MKKYALALAGGMLATGLVAVAPEPVEASGPFDSLKKATKKGERAAKEAKDAADTVGSILGSGNKGNSNSSTTGSRFKGYKGKADPAPAKFVQQLNCASLGQGNAFIARDGEYTFSAGINTEKRYGLIDRKPVEPTSGCLYPSMGVYDVLYLEVDKAKYEKDKYSYDLQCVAYDGSLQLDRSTRPPLDNYKGKDVMLHTGHSLGYTPTASGSNSSRSGEYDKYLASRGRAMITFNMPPLHTDRGTDFFCQHYNKNTGKVALAFTFRRGPGS